MRSRDKGGPMYLRSVFTETDPKRIAALIRAHPFGLLVTSGPRGLEASHIPFALFPQPEGFRLTGHLAAGNPQCDALDGGTALAVFSGPHAYVSPGWYATRPAVPTWDYAAVHVSGRLQPIVDAEAVGESAQAMAERDPTGFQIADLPADFRARMVAGIRAFVLHPERVEAQWKMSQNRSAADRRTVMAALRAQDDRNADAVAALIAATLPSG